MKKLLWFLCIYNLILVLFSSSVFASVKGGHYINVNSVGVKTKDCKPFDKDKIVKIKRTVPQLPIRVIEHNSTY